MTLQQNVWQGYYGEDLVRALATAAGLNHSCRRIDVDGVDLNIGYPGRLMGVGYPCIDVQIKTWRNPKEVQSGEISYPLLTHNYNLLVGEPGVDFPVPRLLFLVVTPNSQEHYVQRGDDFYAFSHTVYWQSIMHLSAVPEDTIVKTVRIPKTNIVTAESLLDLLCKNFGEEAA